MMPALVIALPVDSVDEVQNFASDWLWTYIHERPNMALGGITPKQKYVA